MTHHIFVSLVNLVKDDVSVILQSLLVDDEPLENPRGDVEQSRVLALVSLVQS